MMYYRFLYRPLMRLAHRFHWCYMQPSPIIEKDRLTVWCHWCGARYTHYTGRGPLIAAQERKL